MQSAQPNMPGQKDAAKAMQGGLSEPTLQTQRIFRALMDAMARPGTIKSIKTDARPPAGLMPLAGAVLATLADADTPLWLDESLAAKPAVADWLTFHVGAPFAVEPAGATFAVLSDAQKIASLDIFAQGQQDYPDRSTTLIIMVEELSKAGDWSLSGPGIKTTASLGVTPKSPLFLDQWAANNGRFPRGVDVIFIAPDAIACLPRTTRIDSHKAGEH